MILRALLSVTLLLIATGCDFNKSSDNDDDDEWSDEASWSESTGGGSTGGATAGGTTTGGEETGGTGGTTGGEEAGGTGGTTGGEEAGGTGGTTGGEEAGGEDGSTLENEAPDINILSPSNGDVVGDSSEILFTAVVSDDTDDPATLELVWASDRQGEMGTSIADSTGIATLLTSELMAGTHIITLTATDSEDRSNSDSVTIRVEYRSSDSEDSVDDDGDEWTVEEGDCDDEDFDTHPGAIERCDGRDNNCDGELDTAPDDYEPNEHMGAAYDLGEIDDDWFGGTASITVTDVNFDGPEDEDWFGWFADDDADDHPNVSITVEGDPELYFIVDLFVEEWDTTTPIASQEGWEFVTIAEDAGDWALDEDEWRDLSWDNIYVRVRSGSTEWSDEFCADLSYTLFIAS